MIGKCVLKENQIGVWGHSLTTFTRGGGKKKKKYTFLKSLYHRKCKPRGVGGQKKPNLVNVVCERPLRPFEMPSR